MAPEGYAAAGVDRLIVVCLAFGPDDLATTLDQLVKDVLEPARVIAVRAGGEDLPRWPTPGSWYEQRRAMNNPSGIAAYAVTRSSTRGHPTAARPTGVRQGLAEALRRRPGVVDVARAAAEHQRRQARWLRASASVRPGDELVAAGAVRRHPALHRRDETLAASWRQGTARGWRVALQHLAPLRQLDHRLHAAGPGGLSEPAAVVHARDMRPNVPPLIHQMASARRDLRVAGGRQQRDARATRAADDHRRRHVEVLQQSRHRVGLHRRLRGALEADVGLAAVGPVPDEHLPAPFGQASASSRTPGSSLLNRPPG